jgi:hypothetical protein
MDAAVINPLQEELKTAEAGQAVAALLGISVPETTTWTKQDYIKYMSSASIIHFHGHVQFNEGDPSNITLSFVHRCRLTPFFQQTRFSILN